MEILCKMFQSGSVRELSVRMVWGPERLRRGQGYLCGSWTTGRFKDMSLRQWLMQKALEVSVLIQRRTLKM